MKIALKIIAPLAIIALAVLGFKFLGFLKPKPESKQPPPVVPIVVVSTVSPENHKPPVLSYGTVSSFFETGLTPQVSGRIEFVSPDFRVGKKVDSGHVLVRIDPTDFEAALAERKAALASAERTIAEEKILAEQAAEDWRASGRDLSSASDFVLRKPQLAAAVADIESAKEAIRKAEEDLKRTEVKSPFAAVVTSREASPGNQASPQSALGTLVSRAKAEIRLPLTAGQLARVEIPSKAVLTSPLKPGAEWEAKLVRMEPTVDSQNQVMYAVAEVEDPYADGREDLPVGMFANASIDAKAIDESYRVPEAALVSDRYVWVVDGKDKLKRLDAKRVFAVGGDTFLKLSDDSQGKLRVVTRPLSTFRTGMAVKVEEETTNEVE